MLSWINGKAWIQEAFLIRAGETVTTIYRYGSALLVVKGLVGLIEARNLITGGSSLIIGD